MERILPLATYYTAVTAFIEQRSHLDFGLVNHALCAAMRDMLKDYQVLLSQLEHAFATSPQFTLQKLWFYVHPTLHTLSLLYLLITELATADDPSTALSDSESGNSSDAEEDARNEALGLGGAKLKAVLSEINKGSRLGMDGGASGIPVKGGEVLAILHERMQNMSGDPAARALYGALMRAAGKPYVEMVQMWIRTGKLVDPYEELCIKESKFIDRGTLDVDYTDEYWERRYTVCRRHPRVHCAHVLTHFCSCETVRPQADRRNDTKPVCHHHEQKADIFPVALVYLQRWNAGSRRCS